MTKPILHTPAGGDTSTEGRIPSAADPRWAVMAEELRGFLLGPKTLVEIRTWVRQARLGPRHAIRAASDNLTLNLLAWAEGSMITSKLGAGGFQWTLLSKEKPGNGSKKRHAG